MAKEIERKFLVIDDSYKAVAYKKSEIIQGYISTAKEATIRVRVIDQHAYLTIKSITIGTSRDEWEYEVPYQDAIEMLNKLSNGNFIKKTRFYVNDNGHIWEVDEFHGRHFGLVVAEIELRAENETFTLPSFIGKEVTGDSMYYNSTLVNS